MQILTERIQCIDHKKAKNPFLVGKVDVSAKVMQSVLGAVFENLQGVLRIHQQKKENLTPFLEARCRHMLSESTTQNKIITELFSHPKYSEILGPYSPEEIRYAFMQNRLKIVYWDGESGSFELDIYPQNDNCYENGKIKGPLKLCIRFNSESESGFSIQKASLYPKSEKLGRFLDMNQLRYIKSILLCGPFELEIKQFLQNLSLENQISYIPNNTSEETADIQYHFIATDKNSKQEIIVTIPVGFFQDNELSLYIKTRKLR